MTNKTTDNHHAITPYLIVKDAAAAIDFYKKAFGARELMRIPMGDRIGHAQLEIGDSVFMLADECPQMGAHAPGAAAGSPMSLYLMVPDVDATVKQAVATGAELKFPVSDKFYGHRMGTLMDPFGYMWSVATLVEVVSQDEMAKRMKAMGS